MIRALMTAASGMKAQQKQVDNIANNIANVNTAGFKRSDLNFRSLFYQTYENPGAATGSNHMRPTGLQLGSGVEISGSRKDFRQGELVASGQALDLAIQGEGFFAVKQPNGEVRFTRDGTFHRDGEGNIVTSQGYELLDAPSIPQDVVGIDIAEDGTISTRVSDDQPPVQKGRLKLWRFANPAGLKAQGANLFSETIGSGQRQQVAPGESGTGIIRQGHKERSNVAVVDELVGLILAQRNYEVNSRAVKVSDEMLQQVNQMVR